MNAALRAKGVETLTIDYRKHRYDLAGRVLGIEGDIDAVLVQRGDGFPFEVLRAINRPKLFWASELVARRRDQDRLFASKLFSRVFVRGAVCRDEVIRRGWVAPENVSYMLSACDPTLHMRDLSAQKDIDLLFVGSVTERRARLLRELSTFHSVRIERAYGTEMVKLFNRAKIVVNIHADEFPDTETRVFEALGCGVCLVTEKLGAESPFKNGEHLVEVATMKEMAEKISFLLSHDAERVNIAECGFNEVNAKHTYAHRAEQIMHTVEEIGGPHDTPVFDGDMLHAYKKREPWLGALASVRHLSTRAVRGIKKIFTK